MSQSGKRDEVLALWRGIGEQQDDTTAAKQLNPCVYWYINGPARLCRSVAHKSWCTDGVEP